jgi:predicted phosphate transport protein (TIGR00153 family)
VAFKFRLIPRDEQFFDLFKAMAEEIRLAALDLEAMLSTDPPDTAKVDAIRDAEHRCDTITHDTIQRLHRTFVTPFDREDLYSLATSMDNVMDAIDHSASLVRLYKIREMPRGARELSHTVSASAKSMAAAIAALADERPVTPHAVEINRLENEADRTYAESIEWLFDTVTDPILLMKWKELLDQLEMVTDATEDVANVIESVTVKYS